MNPEFLAKELLGGAVLVSKGLSVDAEMLPDVVVVVGSAKKFRSCRLRPVAADVVMTVAAEVAANVINYIYEL